MPYEPDHIKYTDTVRVLTDKTNQLMSGVAALNTELVKAIEDADPFTIPPKYNVKGDGVTDDYAGLMEYIQDAIDAGKGEVIIPQAPVKYLIGDQILITSPMVLVGRGPKSHIHATFSDKSPVKFLNTHTVGASNLKVSSETPARTASQQGAITIQQCEGFTLDTVSVDGSAATAFFLSGSKTGRVVNCDVRNTLADGIHTTSGSSGIWITNNHCDTTGDDSISVVSYNPQGTPCSDIHIENNYVYNAGARGITHIGGKDVFIKNNIIDKTASSGILIAEDGTYNTFSSVRTTVEDNDIRRVGLTLPKKGNQIGIEVGGSQDTILKNNKVNGSIQRGIVVLPSATNVTLDNNISEENGIVGFVLSGNKMVIKGNRAVRNLEHGFYLDQVTNSSFYDNYSMDNSVATQNGSASKYDNVRFNRCTDLDIDNLVSEDGRDTFYLDRAIQFIDCERVTLRRWSLKLKAGTQSRPVFNALCRDIVMDTFSVTTIPSIGTFPLGLFKTGQSVVYNGTTYVWDGAAAWNTLAKTPDVATKALQALPTGDMNIILSVGRYSGTWSAKQANEPIETTGSRTVLLEVETGADRSLVQRIYYLNGAGAGTAFWRSRVYNSATTTDVWSGWRRLDAGVLDNRTVNSAPKTYTQGSVLEFKIGSTVGLTDEGFALVETLKPWIDDSGGVTRQIAYGSTGTRYSRVGSVDGNSWGVWDQQVGKTYVDEQISNRPINLLANGSGMMGLMGWTTSDTGWAASTDSLTGGVIFNNDASAAGAYKIMDSSEITVPASQTFTMGVGFSGVGDSTYWVEVVARPSGSIIATIAPIQSGFHRRHATFTTPAGTSGLVVRLVTKSTVSAQRVFTKMSLVFGSSDWYNSDSDTKLLSKQPWQKSKMTDDSGNATTVTSINADLPTGYYMGANMVGAPDTNWWLVQVLRHNNLWTVQNAFPFATGIGMRQRIFANGAWQAWSDDLFTSVSSGKASLRTAITGKGGTVTAAGSVPTFSELVGGVNSIQRGQYVTIIGELGGTDYFVNSTTSYTKTLGVIPDGNKVVISATSPMGGGTGYQVSSSISCQSLYNYSANGYSSIQANLYLKDVNGATIASIWAASYAQTGNNQDMKFWDGVVIDWDNRTIKSSEQQSQVYNGQQTGSMASKAPATLPAGIVKGPITVQAVISTNYNTSANTFWAKVRADFSAFII